MERERAQLSQQKLQTAVSIGATILGAGLRHVGTRYTSRANDVSLPAYTVLDASLGWRWSPQAVLRLHLRNLGDRLYASSAYTDGQALLGKPRSADLVLDYRFN